MRPLIGIPPCLDERGRWRADREYHYADAAYARAVSDAGGLPVYLPLGADADELAQRVDGLLVPGGDDFPPDRPYPPAVRFEPVPERQLVFDRALVDAALGRDRPLLAICYGMQLLALARGGTLHFDLASDLPEASEHRLPHAADRHAVRVEAGSRLATLLGGGELAVNSRHHQAVAAAGDARVVARAADGVVEAIELPGARFALGVQWHPESLDAEHRQRLFGGFVAACAAGGGGPARKY